MQAEIKKTSADWAKEVNIMVLDPDGWDRTNYDYSFNQEKITKQEFNIRLVKSTVLVLNTVGSDVENVESNRCPECNGSITEKWSGVKCDSCDYWECY